MRPMLLTLLLAACSVPDGAGLVPGGALPEADTSVPDEVEASFDASVRADLRLKRWRQLSLDLQGALELAADDVCRETDRFDCTTLHVVPLGGVSSRYWLGFRFGFLDYFSATIVAVCSHMVSPVQFACYRVSGQSCLIEAVVRSAHSTL